MAEPIPQFNQVLTKSILSKLGKEDRESSKSLSRLTFAELYRQLDVEETKIIKNLLSLDPKPLGFLGPFVSMGEPPKDLIGLKDQKYTRDGKQHTISGRYLPKNVWHSFQKMQQAIKADIGSKLMVESGYRSPACQAITFLSYLDVSNFDVLYVASGVALPGYSQHGDPVHTACDVINQDGIPDDANPENFEHTKEYRWLIEHAQEFNFHLSYPRGNKFGVKFEPWHWQYLGN